MADLVADAARLGRRAAVAPTGTALRGVVADRPALHGVLDALHLHDLELVDVRRLPPAP